MSGNIPIEGNSIRSDLKVDDHLRKDGYVGDDVPLVGGLLADANPFNDMMGDFIRIVKATQPDALDEASYSYATSRNLVDSTASLIADSAKRLAENWKGEQADAALKTLQQMYKACRQVWETADSTSLALSSQAAVLREHKSVADTPGLAGADAASKWLLPIGGTGVVAGKNEAAKYLMRRLNEDTRRSNDHFPESARAEMPALSVDGSEVYPPPPGSGGPNGGAPTGGAPHAAGALPKSHFPQTHGSPGANLPHGGIPGMGNHQPDGPVGHLPGSGLPHAPGGGTSLAGIDPSGAATPLGGGPGGGLPGGGLPGGGLGTGAPNPFESGPGSAGGLGGIGAAGAFGGRGLGAGTSGAGGRGMMPMAPHGGQEDENERERSTWLSEDEDVWGSGGDAAPPVIG